LLAAAYIFRILKYAFANPETASELRMPLPLPRAMELLPLLLALLSLAVGLAGIPHAAILAIGSPFT
jgi:NADH:ubiquinone oxidoreductase subunit 5 (subunit L)/multisubunit Na+/H+ antiporter MnhA subunit